MGGGRAFFLPEGTADPDPDPGYVMDEASRTDGLNLVEVREGEGEGGREVGW